MKTVTCSLMILVLCGLMSCKKQAGDSVSVDLDISVVNSQGQDLLNSVYTKDNIILSHLVDGKNVPYVKIPSDGIFKDGLHILKVFPYNTSQPSITLIQFGDTKPDTIRREFLRGENYIYCSKVWFNEELKYDDNKITNKYRRFTIVK